MKTIKKLSRCAIAELEIEDKFAGKQWAYTAVIDKDGDGIGLGIAVANEPGYSPIPLYWCRSDDWDEMSAHADDLNRERGMSDDEAVRVVASTHAAQNRRDSQIAKDAKGKD